MNVIEWLQLLKCSVGSRVWSIWWDQLHFFNYILWWCKKAAWKSCLCSIQHSLWGTILSIFVVMLFLYLIRADMSYFLSVDLIISGFGYLETIAWLGLYFLVFLVLKSCIGYLLKMNTYVYFFTAINISIRYKHQQHIRHLPSTRLLC